MFGEILGFSVTKLAKTHCRQTTMVKKNFGAYVTRLAENTIQLVHHGWRKFNYFKFRIELVFFAYKVLKISKYLKYFRIFGKYIIENRTYVV